MSCRRAVAIAAALVAAHGARAQLVEEGDWQLVAGTCQACHGLALVTQHRLSRDRWRDTIRWMQGKHNLWDLGDSEPRILDYLAEHYGETGRDFRPRRQNLPRSAGDAR